MWWSLRRRVEVATRSQGGVGRREGGVVGLRHRPNNVLGALGAGCAGVPSASRPDFSLEKEL